MKVNNLKIKNNEYRSDVDYLIKELENKHICLYFDKSKKETDDYIKNLLFKYPVNTIWDLYYVSASIISRTLGPYDQHTNVYPHQKDWPSVLKYIDNKLYLIDSDNEKAKFKYIVKINNIDINKLINEYRNMIYCENEAFFVFWIESFVFGFCNMFVIKSLPSISKEDNNISIELNDGTILNYEYNGNYEYLKYNIKQNMTFYLKDGIPVIIYNRCRDDENMMHKLVEALSEIDTSKVVVDLRYNGGGNSSVIEPLIELLKKRSSKILILVNEKVFSAGCFAIISLKKIGGKSIGTDVAMPMNSFGNLGDGFELPKSKLKGNYSYKYFYFENNQCFNICTKEDFAKFNIAENKHYFKPIYLKPDIYCKEKIEDIQCDRDITLEKAIEILNY